MKLKMIWKGRYESVDKDRRYLVKNEGDWNFPWVIHDKKQKGKIVAYKRTLGECKEFLEGME